MRLHYGSFNRVNSITGTWLLWHSCRTPRIARSPRIRTTRRVIKNRRGINNFVG